MRSWTPHLVGGWPTPLKNDGLKVSWDDDIPFPIWWESQSKFHGSSQHQPDISKKHHEPLFFTTFFTTMKTGVFHGQSKHIQSTNQLNRSLGLITRFDPLFSRKVPPGSSLFASAAVSRAPSAIPRGPAQRWRSRRSLWKPKRFWLTKNDDIIVGIYMYVTVYIQYKHNMYIHIYNYIYNNYIYIL